MHLVHTEGVTGSIPVASTILFNGLAFSLAVAPQNTPQERRVAASQQPHPGRNELGW
jgi:hypothetical protein